MFIQKCGVYRIKCGISGKSYVGSSVRILKRWSEHRLLLRKGKHTSYRLQRAWDKHGEVNFDFSILEECASGALLDREDFYIKSLGAEYNCLAGAKIRSISAETLARRNASLRARAAAITHCPKGHEYTQANTYIGKAGKRICRQCNADRVSGVYARETSEQRELRRQKVAASFEANKDARHAQMLKYRQRTRDRKAAYDRAHLAEKRARRARKRLNHVEIIQELGL